MGVKRVNHKLLRYFARKIVVHDVIGAFEQSMAHRGDATFSYRALAIPARAVYVPREYRPTIAGLPTYLASLGIGPQEVRFVSVHKRTTLLESVAADLLRRGESLRNFKLSLYGQSKKTQELLASEANKLYPKISRPEAIQKLKSVIGLPALRIGDVTGGIANNKLFLRMMLEYRLEEHARYPDSLNIDFVSVRHGQNLSQHSWLEAVERILRKKNKRSVVVKATNFATGDLVQFCSSVEEIRDFIEKSQHLYPELKLEFVIEENMQREKKAELSAQFLIDEKGKVVFLHATRNLVRKNKKGDPVVHWGNMVIGDRAHPVNAFIWANLARLARIPKFYAQHGFRGYLSLDLLQLQSDRLKVLEMNGRVTGATYPLLVFEQLAKARGRKMVVLATNSLFPRKHFKTFGAVRFALSDLLLTTRRKSGIIPLFTAMLPKRLGVAIVGRDTEEVKDVLSKACERLRITKPAVLSDL